MQTFHLTRANSIFLLVQNQVVIQQNAASAEESASASEEMNAQSNQMKAVVKDLVKDLVKIIGIKKTENKLIFQPKNINIHEYRDMKTNGKNNIEYTNVNGVS